MTTQRTQHRLVVPPVYMGDLVGITSLRIGIRKVWASMQNGAVISVSRKAIKIDPTENFMGAANEVLIEHRRLHH